jgi:hypothetical protein
MIVEQRRKPQMPMTSSAPKPPFKRLVVFTSVTSLDATA